MFSFVAGITIGGFKYPPYDTIRDIYKQIIPQKTELEEQTNFYYKEVDVSSLIHIRSEADLLQKRTALINYIWKEDGFSYDKIPDEIEQDIKDDRFSDLKNLARIDKLTTMMDYGVDSKAYLFLASKSNNKLVIYHQGHDGAFILGKNTIQYFLEKHYSILAFSMPLLEPNSQPVVDLPSFGKIKLTSHDDLQFLESNSFSPIRFFVEPISVSLNYAEKTYGFDSYYMVGISGGGWTTVLYSSIDPRISKSYPVAGSVPMYLRFNNQKNMGDYEQMLPQLYRVAEYLDLYIMASYGDNREQLQIFNKYDPCCFSGTGYTTYEDEIKKTVSDLGKGKFEVFLDTHNKMHSISDESLDIILKSIENN